MDDIQRKVDTFFGRYPSIEYSKDQILLLPGEVCTKIFYIVSGRVCQYDISYRGDEVIVNTFKPPRYFPMALAINDHDSNFFYKTEVRSELRVAPVADVRAFLKSNPDALYDLLSRVYIGLESILQRMVHLMSGTAKSRVLFELIIEFRRFSDHTDSSGYLDVTEASMASRSGLSRETVNREIRHLKERGLITIERGKIYIRNVSELENLLVRHI